jgi:arabinogalactan oligomer/maltooligosaccharide transport system permease protein
MAESAVLESNLEYLSLSKPQRVLYRISHFFTGMPKKAARFFTSIPGKARKHVHTTVSVGKTVVSAAAEGDWKTRLSFLLMGLGLVTRHQIVRGILYFLYELIFIFFMVRIGGPSLAALPSLGQMGQVIYSITDPATGIDVTPTLYYDNSFTIMLYSIITLALILVLVFLWYGQLKDSLKLQKLGEIGKHTSDKQSWEDVFDRKYDKTLLFLPMTGLVLFTIIPMVMMILIAFTDYNTDHLTPLNLFDWVGWNNFQNVFSSASTSNNTIFLQVFGKVLLWTLIWAFFATFSNYFLGMIVAMIINMKGIRLKKLWRTVLITTIAVPQFISLLLVANMFDDSGMVNAVLRSWGWIDAQPIKWLSDPILAKVMIIILNTWVGIPYTMLICTGLLMNIPEDLYESARIDGASPAKMYFKITLPYMLFVTTPYLISQFVGNINNFNVIYLLSGGGPAFLFYGTTVPTQVADTGVGQTDLLITWIYKMTVTSQNKDYGAASVIGLLIFAVVAFFSLIFYNNSKSVQDEEEFQ